jgi:HD-GYP domain-containing protein (c-di-GMP phosphodiesterase class II)
MSRSLDLPQGALRAAAAVGGLSLAWFLDSRRQRKRSALIHRTMVELLLNTLCSGDPGTARHSRRVADMTDVVGGTFGMNREARARLRVAALLHDLGKLDGQLQPIIHSHHRLDEHERSQVKAHTNESADILQPLEAIHPGISRIAESHHERWDGKGYPQGLAGPAIPLESRIISVADVFDAMTEPRSYKGALAPEKALEEIRSGAGTRFDPQVVARLERPEVWSEWVRIARRGQQDEERKVEAERGREELQAAGQAERRG